LESLEDKGLLDVRGGTVELTLLGRLVLDAHQQAGKAE